MKKTGANARCYTAQVLSRRGHQARVHVLYKPSSAVDLWIDDIRECEVGHAGTILFGGYAREQVELAIKQDTEARAEARRLG